MHQSEAGPLIGLRKKKNAATPEVRRRDQVDNWTESLQGNVSCTCGRALKLYYKTQNPLLLFGLLLFGVEMRLRVCLVLR